jgi:hypothetical protein
MRVRILLLVTIGAFLSGPFPVAAQYGQGNKAKKIKEPPPCVTSSCGQGQGVKELGDPLNALIGRSKQKKNSGTAPGEEKDRERRAEQEPSEKRAPRPSGSRG